MIRVDNLSKVYHTRSGSRTIFRDVNLTISPGEKVGILGRNGAGKSTLIRLLSGVEKCTTGNIQRDMTLSWPIAFGGGFQGSLTGMDNLKFICRVYNVSAKDKLPFIEEFSELGRYLYEPLKTYSAGMRARLNFAISMAIEFDCYLIDEVMAVGDNRFRQKCNHELFEVRGDRALILVSHNPEQVRKHCETFCVIKDNTLQRFEDPDEAYEYYQTEIAA